MFGINKTPETKTFKRMKHYLTRKLNGTLGFKETKIPDFWKTLQLKLTSFFDNASFKKKVIRPYSSVLDPIIKI